MTPYPFLKGAYDRICEKKEGSIFKDRFESLKQYDLAVGAVIDAKASAWVGHNQLPNGSVVLSGMDMDVLNFLSEELGFQYQ